MKELLIGKITDLSLLQIMGVFVFLLFCVLVLLFGIVFAFDKLNIKAFNFHDGFTFYQDGDEKKSRITGRRKTVMRKTK